MKAIFIVYIIIYFTLVSCSQNLIVFPYGDKNIHGQCKFKIDGNYELKRYKDDHGNTEWLLKFQNESIFFITNNSKKGSEFNKSKYEELGKNINLRFISSDTLTIEGRTASGYWKEVKRGNITFGYFGVSPDKKSIFDQFVAQGCQ